MAESWDIILAKKFKERDNKIQIGNIIGKVIKQLPDIKISILDGNIVLNKEQLYCCESLITSIENGDEVLLLHTVDEQTWFIIDKIKKL